MAIREHTSLQRTQKRVSTKVLARASYIESEKVLEAKLRKEITARGGMALKLLSQLHRGLPDRLVLMPGGRTYFAEIKTTGKKPTTLQVHCHHDLIGLGFPVFVIDSTQKLEEMLNFIELEGELSE